ASPALASIPGPVDLALVCTPAKTLPGVIAQCGQKGVKGAVVLAGGFAESGPDGAALQGQMVDEARKYGVRIVGPNTSGIFNTHAGCNIVGFSDLKKGGVGLLTQSGNMALSLATEAQSNGNLGLSTYVGIGNESDIRFDEYLDYFRDDENTSVLVVYVEGVKDGPRFLEGLRSITRKKPVVVYKSGRTSAGQNSAKSHTGALAGDYAVNDGVLRQAGAILARKSDEILPLAEALSLLGPLASRRVAVLADGGGHATIAADSLTELGMELPALSKESQDKLAALLPSGAALVNPVDVAGGTDSNPAVFAECAEIMLADPSVDGLIITGLFGGYGTRFSETLMPIELETMDAIAALRLKYKKPILVHSLYGYLCPHERPESLVRIREAGIPVYSSLELGTRCMQAMAEFGETMRRPQEAAAKPTRPAVFDRILAACREQGRDFVMEHEAREILAAAGAKMAPVALAATADEAAKSFAALGRVPVAMKIVSRDIIHKSDAGGVVLNVTDEDGARKAFATIIENAGAYQKKHSLAAPDITGVLMTPMAKKGGVEVIIGVVKDPSYGSVMMFGLGGVLVEVLKDVAFRAVPLSEYDARAMMGELKGRAILDGVRGAKGVDKEALVALMRRLSALCAACPEIKELDMNPVLAYPDGVDILDARILLDLKK
ncbi:MAG: acetate--CoA ligase family protein, partial [Deltaproteobacteria bacterium]|nr:acetate--CoA ligase family protein [Deltaproteobacteria bacterium]